ncbi:hypothetical protein [Thiocystis violascens]|uniref:Uncharacterized protein n=1 Tax=Thiocystis violascens (strain ATCC 17096 / DSM 198 / 6111) TaxID=765911 RepID=I3Y7L9_THIV6|nr:hypothetical protein [Thiocystis violascens]AFL72987.1 hypothetical protein Thivi_0952 [Thiocystis violascens DSM 198]
MLNTAGLSLDQAPPIGVPFAFFLTAPLFAVAAGGLLLWQGELVLISRWTPPALAVTHLIALGFLTQIMCGALLQMLPVLAGSPVPRVVLVGRATQVLLILGTLSLSADLLWGGAAWLTLGGGSLMAGLTIFATAAGSALARARGVRRTVVAMRLALVALLVTLLLGVLLVVALLGGWRVAGFVDWVNLHLAWGLLGWAGLLIMGVGYQVVPMFHVTPAYPDWLMRWAAPLVAVVLTVASALTANGQGAAATGWMGLSTLCFVVFAGVSLDRQRRRERPRLDATLLYWRSAMISALLAAALWLAGGRAELVGVLVLIGVGVGLPSGMLFKIVPFLSWFHLQHRQVATRRFDVRVPHMHTFIPEAPARIQFGLYLVALLALVAAAALPAFDVAPGVGKSLARLGGLALVLSSGFLWFLLARSFWRFRGFGL